VSSYDDTVVLHALAAATSGGRSFPAYAWTIAKHTPDYMTRTASGRQRQPMGERRARRALDRLVADGLAIRGRNWGSGHHWELTLAGRSACQHFPSPRSW